MFIVIHETKKKKGFYVEELGFIIILETRIGIFFYLF